MDTPAFRVFTRVDGRSAVGLTLSTPGYILLDDLLAEVERVRAEKSVTKSTPLPLWLRALFAHCPRGYIFVQYNHLPDMAGIATTDMPDSRLLALSIDGQPYESLEALLDSSPGTYDLVSGKATRYRMSIDTEGPHKKVCESTREALLWLQGTTNVEHEYGLINELMEKISNLRRQEEQSLIAYQRAEARHTDTIVRLGIKHLEQIKAIQLEVDKQIASQVDKHLSSLGLTRKDLEELAALRTRAKTRANIELEID